MQNPKIPQLLSKDGSIHITDEVYNTLLSSVGALLFIIGVTALVYRSYKIGNFWAVVGFSVYGFGVISTFITSALHHGVNGSPKTNHLLRQLDYYAIFLMIAGSFTPFCLIHLRNGLGWTVLGLIWGLAILGITLKALYPHISKWFLLSLYIGMGWLAMVIAKPIFQVIHWEGMFGILLGGFFFTAGGLIFGLEKPNPFPGKFGFHEIWHCFVLAGAASHFYVMYWCV